MMMGYHRHGSHTVFTDSEDFAQQEKEDRLWHLVIGFGTQV